MAVNQAEVEQKKQRDQLNRDINEISRLLGDVTLTMADKEREHLQSTLAEKRTTLAVLNARTATASGKMEATTQPPSATTTTTTPTSQDDGKQINGVAILLFIKTAEALLGEKQRVAEQVIAPINEDAAQKIKAADEEMQITLANEKKTDKEVRAARICHNLSTAEIKGRAENEIRPIKTGTAERCSLKILVINPNASEGMELKNGVLTWFQNADIDFTNAVIKILHTTTSQMAQQKHDRYAFPLIIAEEHSALQLAEYISQQKTADPTTIIGISQDATLRRQLSTLGVLTAESCSHAIETILPQALIQMVLPSILAVAVGEEGLQRILREVQHILELVNKEVPNYFPRLTAGENELSELQTLHLPLRSSQYDADSTDAGKNVSLTLLPAFECELAALLSEQEHNQGQLNKKQVARLKLVQTVIGNLYAENEVGLSTAPDSTSKEGATSQALQQQWQERQQEQQRAEEEYYYARDDADTRSSPGEQTGAAASDGRMGSSQYQTSSEASLNRFTDSTVTNTSGAGQDGGYSNNGNSL